MQTAKKKPWMSIPNSTSLTCHRETGLWSFPFTSETNPSVTTTVAQTTTTQGDNTTTSLPISKATTAFSVTREQAIDIALGAAGLTRDAVYDLEAEPDREFGGIYWEVDFETREYEYSYDINAESGEIVRSERERN